jgi:hypothetical protein
MARELAAVWLPVIAALAACSGAETVEIGVVARDPIPPCGQLRANLLVLELHELAGPPGADPCFACVTGAGCRLVDRSCRCGEAVDVTRESLDAGLTGVRLGALEAGARYCVRLLAIDAPEPSSPPWDDCDCPDLVPPLLMDHAEACGAAGPFAPEDAAGQDRPIEVAPLCAEAGDDFGKCLFPPPR